MSNSELPLTKIKNNIERLILLTGKFKHNRVARNGLISTVGLIISMFTMLFFTPALVRRMGTEGYGLWSISISTLGMMGMLDMGLGLAISKYIAEYHVNQNAEGISAVVTIGLYANLLLGLCLSLPLYFFAAQIAGLFASSTLSSQDIAMAIQIASFGFLPLLLRNTVLSIPNGLQRYEFSTVVKTSQSILVIVVALAVVVLGGTIQQVVLSTVLVMCVAAFISVIIAAKMLKPIIVKFPVVKRNYTRQMFSFMAFTGLRGVGAQLFSSLDRIVVGIVLGLSSAAYYTVCIGVANKFVALSNQLTRALMPAVSAWHASGEEEKLRRYFAFSSGGLTILNLAGGLILIVFAEKILTLWMGLQFTQQALVPFQILVFIYAIMTITAPASQVADGIGIPWVNAVVSLSTGIGTVALIVILGKQFGLAGAAFANIASWSKFFVPIMVIRLLRQIKADKVSMEYA